MGREKIVNNISKMTLPLFGFQMQTRKRIFFIVNKLENI